MMTKSLEVHPIAAMFPMMSKDELQEMAEDIKANGLHETIKISADGKTLIDGRNRLAACKIAKVEPRFENLNGAEAEAYVISANIARRHMTGGQRAAVVAKIYPEPASAQERGAKGGRGNKSSASPSGAFPMVAPSSLRLARMVMRDAPDLIDSVIDGSLTLEKAAVQARDRRDLKSSREAKLEMLHAGARDLANRVKDDGMDIDEALAAMKERERKTREIIEQG